MVKLRLIPTGKSVQPSFRVVAIDARTKLNGKYIDILGFYDPIKKVVKINEELTLKFLLTGAQPTDTVRNLLSKQGVLEKFHTLKIEQKKATATKNKTKTTSKKAAVKTVKAAKETKTK
ncbi:MAG: 30S ribosomal protein S16 [Spiroplasma sp.]|nr:30S ribosomal protein S16 [Spiroplasma sp.]